MTVRFVLDSDVLIDLFVGREPAGTVIPNLLEMDLAGTTVITAHELYAGAVSSGGRGRIE